MNCELGILIIVKKYDSRVGPSVSDILIFSTRYRVMSEVQDCGCDRQPFTGFLVQDMYMAMTTLTSDVLCTTLVK